MFVKYIVTQSFYRDLSLLTEATFDSTKGLKTYHHREVDAVIPLYQIRLPICGRGPRIVVPRRRSDAFRTGKILDVGLAVIVLDPVGNKLIRKIVKSDRVIPGAKSVAWILSKAFGARIVGG